MALRDIEGITNKWLLHVERVLNRYLEYCNREVNKGKTLEYIQTLKNKYSISTYRKRVFQIRKFLEYLSIDWASNIKPPSEPTYKPKHIQSKDIEETLGLFKDDRFELQIKAILYLGASSGMRAEELYQLREEDLDLNRRIVYINHNPKTGQTTKTKKSRVSFFNSETKQAIEEYLKFFNNGCELNLLFGKKHMNRLFKNAPIQVKDLRKYFSQEWTRRNGNQGVKKLLMGHSTRNDVDLSNYNAQSPEELKEIYDTVMSKPLL